MTKFNIGDHVVVANREDKWDGLTGVVRSVSSDRFLNDTYYRLTMDEPFSSPISSYTDGISAGFFESHLEPFDEADFVEDDYTRSARIVKNYMEDNRLLSADIDEDQIQIMLALCFKADLLEQGYTTDRSHDEAMDKASYLMPYLETIRPVLEAYWNTEG